MESTETLTETEGKIKVVVSSSETRDEGINNSRGKTCEVRGGKVKKLLWIILISIVYLLKSSPNRVKIDLQS